jgi:cell division septation protein DedD
MMRKNRGVRDVVAAAVVAFAIAAVLLATTHARAHAQVQDQALDRIQNLIATGRFTEARNTLERWERDHGDPRSSAGPGDRARALFLRGVLASDVRAAEDAYVGVVLSYPSSAVAPDALLRLGQGLLTAGEAQRAVAYLERLRSDYPGAPARETGLLWLARAQLAAGMAGVACTTARDGAAAASSANIRTLMEVEQDRACAASPPPPSRQTVPPPPAAAATGAATGAAQRTAAAPQAAPPASATPPATGAAAAAGAPPAAGTAAATAAGTAAATGTAAAAAAANLRFAVQTGAYRELSSAENIARQMRAQGFDARVVLVGDSPLYRVRVGAFATTQEATSASDRIRSAGFAVIVVDDVPSERR